jgi:hypothetical protein
MWEWIARLFKGLFSPKGVTQIGKDNHAVSIQVFNYKPVPSGEGNGTHVLPPPHFVIPFALTPDRVRDFEAVPSGYSIGVKLRDTNRLGTEVEKVADLLHGKRRAAPGDDAGLLEGSV